MRNGTARETRLEQRQGFFSPTEAEIVIGTEGKRTHREETYIHELIEIAVWVYDLRIPHEHIQQLGVALHQALTSGKGRLR